jgi:3-oxocholest-4-en-26-oate---CoA ligase
VGPLQPRGGSNGAAPLSDAVRDEIRRALPGRFILDSYGSLGVRYDGLPARRRVRRCPAGAPKFGVGSDVEVVDADMRPCPPGVDGMLGRTGSIPLGHYNDPEKTAATFKEIDGARWAIPGDFARREEDGSVTVLGRGSVCINTGGEKVHPEEVEATMPRHPAVADAVVIGTPHKRWGQQVTALVQVREGAAVTAEDLRAHVRSLVAGYKVPKEVLFVPEVPRTPVSEVDYTASTELARRLLG